MAYTEFPVRGYLIGRRRGPKTVCGDVARGRMATLHSKIHVGQDVLFRDLDGEAVVLNLKTGKYYGLDEVGTRMWALLAQHGQVEPVYQALLAEYDVAGERLQLDLLGFVDELASHGLVQIAEA
jgi:hypothetical protein